MNVPMAVVVQELVDANAAGVMFTCDAVTGSPAQITVTANYGLGEVRIMTAVFLKILIYDACLLEDSTLSQGCQIPLRTQ